MTTMLPADPTSPETQAAFFPWLRHMRETDPVNFDPLTGQWHIFGIDDCVHVMTRPDLYVNDMTELAPPQEDYDLFLRGNIAAMDEPVHRQMRSIVSKAFTARYAASLQPGIEATAAQLLDAVGAADEFDLVSALAYPLPVIVIAELLGVPAEDRDVFGEWATVIHSNGGEGLDEMEAVAPSLRQMNTYLLELIRRRRTQPLDDLVTKLVQAEHEGKRLDDEEIVGFVGVLLMAGHLTTTAMITNIALLFDQNPDQWRRIKADRSLVGPALEEVVRLRPSFTRFVRMAASDSEVAGNLIGEGSLVNVWVASANRDTARFADPDRFDIGRFPNKHVGYGQGIHYCIGAALARVECAVTLNLLLDRFTDFDVRYEQGVSYLDPGIMLGATHLPTAVRRV